MKVIVIVVDSLGIGELPDARRFGDQGSNTLAHIHQTKKLFIPNMRRLGLGNIEGLEDLKLSVAFPIGIYGKLAEKSDGKDTITGHWEIAGVETREPLRTYPHGFPEEIMDEFVRKTGRDYIGNCVASGTEIIEELGPEHEATGKVIVYTSADSVFQVAANTNVVSLEELYSICETARKIFSKKYQIGRVIARPYIIAEDGKRRRTNDRRDYAISPPEKTALEIIKDSGKEVYAIGKIYDIFNGVGITKHVKPKNDDDAITKTIEAIGMNFSGLIFTNLVEFDAMYGHRNDPIGYARAIEAFDKRIPQIEAAMGEDDFLLICSDHGNDPCDESFDHTREYIFCIGGGPRIRKGYNVGLSDSFADIGATVVDYLTNGKEKTLYGTSMRDKILDGAIK